MVPRASQLRTGFAPSHPETSTCRNPLPPSPQSSRCGGGAVVPLPALSQEGPAGPAFYDIPAPLPEGAPGTPIRQRALEGTMALPSAARNHLVMYLSRDPAGQCQVTP
jgi:hypothetical protein